MPVAIVSLACRYPDAPGPAALWDNVLAGRRAFRALPPERLDLARYAAERVGVADSITRVRAGLITDWQFDHARFRIPQPTCEAADLTHWLALEVAAEAIAAAGGPARLDAARTAVVVANTLTGEFSRAALLRLRAPFLDDVLSEALASCDIAEGQGAELRRRFRDALRARFPDPQEETLAGGLANTIAGRVANFFDLNGGAYTVDAACAASLVALSDAVALLERGEVDAVVTGAVDLSLDPFELVGFSRNGALAAEDFRVFDRRSSGFWPGEGAGFAVLMRAEDARRREFPVLAVLRGCGLSTDGAGGFTRPSVEGQVLALRRAYARADVDPADVGYVEAHGTGTAVGDPVEVRALATLREGARRALPIGSIKANIGHTKAAAGFAGLVKTVAALRAGIVPPHVGCTSPHPVFAETGARVHPALAAEAWSEGAPRIAGLSAFGFGGINAHVVLEGPSSSRAVALPPPPLAQDAELFVFAGDSDGVAAAMTQVRERAPTLSLAEFSDTAAQLARARAIGPWRVAIVAATPEELAEKLDRACDAIAAGRELTASADAVAIARDRHSRIGLLFPGQAAPSRPKGGLWAKRFDDARALFARVPDGADPIDTRVAQPAIAAASLAALGVLTACGVRPAVVCGHSVGELAALAAAGALAGEDLVPLAAARGATMAAHGRAGGGMLRIAASAADVETLIDGLALVIACRNGTEDIVVAGPGSDLAIAAARAQKAGRETTALAASHAFHSPMMAPVAAPFAAVLGAVSFQAPTLPLVSTITGDVLASGESIPAALLRQLEAPVLFDAALARLRDMTDLLIEAGPGGGLTRLARQAGLAALSVDAGADTLRPLLIALGAAFVHGQALDLAPLFAGRAPRPIDLASRPRFLRNPCGDRGGIDAPPLVAPETPPPLAAAPPAAADDLIALVRTVVAEETGFAPAQIRDGDRFLDDLHLNSIAVARMVSKAAQRAGLRMPETPTEFANASPAELAAGLAALRDLAPRSETLPDRIPGIRPWLRAFVVNWRPAPPARPGAVRWRMLRVAADDGPTLPDNAGADGVLVWLGARFCEDDMPALFAACRSAWNDAAITQLALCHAGAPIAAFARSLSAERRFAAVTVVERPADGAAHAAVLAELSAETDGYRERRVHADGRIEAPHFECAPVTTGPAAPLGRGDVILVTGGAKGIGAECALTLARKSGAALILAGRSAPDDTAVAATLARAEAEHFRCRYARADVTDAAALARAVAEAARGLGPVTALIHAAGLNEPMRFPDIGDAELAAAMAPKLAGLRAAAAAAGPSLRRIVTFGSIIGRMGLMGEAHYATANAWQTALADAMMRDDPRRAALSLEWSIWNGAGMGHRLGSIERLARQGVDAIGVDEGVAMFVRLVQGGAVGSLIVTGRFGPPRQVTVAPAELPMRRFIDRPLLHYPGLELVVETTLTRGRDLSLDDHRIDGLAVLPGVLGLEALAQAACALTGQARPAAIEAVAFRQAIVVPDDGALRIRIVTLAGEDGRVEAAIRSEEDGFATDRLRATFVFTPGAEPAAPARGVDSEKPVEAAPLYGTLFFQGERFRRIGRFTRLAARRIAATLRADPSAPWFAAVEPQDLVLGDPGARDALLHALQAAVPHRRVVPVSVARIALAEGGAPARMEAVETAATADTFTFDITAYDAQGVAVDSWRGATFRAIADIAVDALIAAVPALAAPFVERVARAATGEGSIEVALVAGRGAAARRTRALAALGLAGRVVARGDGKPIVIGADAGLHVSLAHCADFTLAVKARREIACDMEPADARPPDGLAQPANGNGTEPALRLWTCNEVALKRGLSPAAPLSAPTARGAAMIFENAAGRTATIRLGGIGGGLLVAIGAPLPAEAGEAP